LSVSTGTNASPMARSEAMVATQRTIHMALSPRIDMTSFHSVRMVTLRMVELRPGAPGQHGNPLSVTFQHHFDPAIRIIALRAKRPLVTVNRTAPNNDLA